MPEQVRVKLHPHAQLRISTKQVEAYAVLENGVWLVISVVVKFF